jgi:hypothetical protein
MEVEQIKWNSLVKVCELVKIDEGVKVIATLIKIPLITERLMVDTMYLWKKPEEHEYIAILSSEGNDEIREKYIKEKGLEKCVYGVVTLIGHWYKPLYKDNDPTKEIIGTRIFYINVTDPGGNIPDWLKRRIAPKAVSDTYDMLITACKKLKL